MPIPPETSVVPVMTRDTSDIVIPVIEERLTVGKRVVETGEVKVHTTVAERDETVELLLKRQDLSVERVPVGREVTASMPTTRQEGDTVIVPILEEVMVVTKRLMLKEELHIRRIETETTERQTVRLRTETASLEQSGNVMDLTRPVETIKEL